MWDGMDGQQLDDGNHTVPTRGYGSRSHDHFGDLIILIDWSDEHAWASDPVSYTWTSARRPPGEKWIIRCTHSFGFYHADEKYRKIFICIWL